jgi:hypothetical protein
MFLTIPAGFVTNEDQGCVMAAMEYTRLAQLQYDGGYVPYSTVLQPIFNTTEKCFNKYKMIS